MATSKTLRQPTAIQLSRLSDRLSFLYLDKCNIEQDDNGTLAKVNGGTQKEKTTYLPISTLTCLILGHGTTITQQAVANLSRSGCAVVFVGAGGVRSYGAFLSPYASTTLLYKQAEKFSDPVKRIAWAKAMYAKRFPDEMLFSYAPDDVTIEQLRGVEGARMKTAYQSEARKHRVTKWRRDRGDSEFGPTDNVNIALNFANTALYGVTNAVVLALGLSPGLGAIHHGNRQAFVLDIADFYKTDVTIPLAFSLHDSDDPGNDAMRKLRDQFCLLRLIPRMVDDIYELLDEDIGQSGEWDVDELFLWGTNGLVQSGQNFDTSAIERGV